jgi:hypothetical protein
MGIRNTSARAKFGMSRHVDAEDMVFEERCGEAKRHWSQISPTKKFFVQSLLQRGFFKVACKPKL